MARRGEPAAEPDLPGMGAVTGSNGAAAGPDPRIAIAASASGGGARGENGSPGPPAGGDGGAGAEPMPRVLLTRRQVVASGLFILLGVGFLYFVLPKLTGLGTTVHRIERGDTWWIAIGVVLEVLSFAGYVVLFRAVFVGGRGHPQSRIGWGVSYEITMAGLVATRLFATAGAAASR